MWKRANNSSSGGGQMVETLLWTNPDPTVPNTGFAAQTVTLLDDINNYDYISVECCRSRTNTSALRKVYYTVEEYKTFALAAGSRLGTVSDRYNASTNESRSFHYIDDISLRFNQCIAYSGSGGTIVNTYLIPTNVYGCKIR